MLLFNMCGLLPLANCLGIPVLTTGIRRYTTESNRGFAFGLFYVIMNVAALVSGPVVDALTIWHKGDSNDNDDQPPSRPTNEWHLSSYRAIILTGILANVVACIVSLTVREIKVDGSAACPTGSVVPGATNYEHQFDESSDSQENRSINNETPRIKDFQPTRGSAIRIFKETVQTKSFWRFLVVCLINLNVRMIFRPLDATRRGPSIRLILRSLSFSFLSSRRQRRLSTL